MTILISEAAAEGNKKFSFFIKHPHRLDGIPRFHFAERKLFLHQLTSQEIGPLRPNLVTVGKPSDQSHSEEMGNSRFSEQLRKVVNQSGVAVAERRLRQHPIPRSWRPRC
jgi:hypothetical protein